MITKMKTASTLASGALVASAMMMAISAASIGTANAAEMEKCYGVAKAGKNDCATDTSSCAGTSKMDSQKDAFVAVPKGTCDKLAGGSLMPMMPKG